MTDRAIQAQRRAMLLDPSERARWLRERLRSGEVCGTCDGNGELGMKGGQFFTHDEARFLPTRTVLNAEIVPCPDCAGLSLRKRIELAAYCGDEASREVLPCGACSDQITKNGLAGICPGCGAVGTVLACQANFSPAFPDWLSGLDRYGPLVTLDAAIAAAWVVLPIMARAEAETDTIPFHGDPEADRAEFLWRVEFRAKPMRRAIEAAEACRADPTYANRTKVERIMDELQGQIDYWLWGLLRHAVYGLVGAGRYWHAGCTDSARVAGEAPVRQAICKRLIEWSGVLG